MLNKLQLSINHQGHCWVDHYLGLSISLFIIHFWSWVLLELGSLSHLLGFLDMMKFHFSFYFLFTLFLIVKKWLILHTPLKLVNRFCVTPQINSTNSSFCKMILIFYLVYCLDAVVKVLYVRQKDDNLQDIPNSHNITRGLIFYPNYHYTFFAKTLPKYLFL